MTGIAGAAASDPDKTAIVWRHGVITFGELDDRQTRVAGALREAGLKRGDRVAVWSRNRPELLDVTVGCLRAGIVPVPIHASLTAAEAAYMIEDSGARWLFTDRTTEPHHSLEGSITFGDAFERLLHASEPAALGGLARGRPMHYTSGTTGAPKGVWVAPTDEGRAATLSSAFRRTWAITGDDVHLVVSPLSHSAPHRFALRTLEAGGTVALLERFDAAEVLLAVELFTVTSTFMVPTHLERIFALGHRPLARHDLSSVRLLAHAGAPIRKVTKKAAIETFPDGSVWEFYGSTEGGFTRLSSEEWLRKPGSVGTPAPGVKILITADDGAELGPMETGQVWVHDPRAERFEYWGDPAKTSAAWRGDAFTAGDLGYLDDDGYLFLTGRLNDTIISGGVNVYPQEVEAVLMSHPSVAEAVVFGVPDEEWGQQVRAWIIPAPEQPLDPERLQTWLRERMAAHKCPKVIEVVDDLPRTPTGKPRRPTGLEEG